MVRPSSSDVWPRARSLTTTSVGVDPPGVAVVNSPMSAPSDRLPFFRVERRRAAIDRIVHYGDAAAVHTVFIDGRSEEHTSELQSLTNLVCRLLLEKKK